MTEYHPLTADCRIQLLQRITCPHCWHEFAPEDTLWISQHAELLGDPRLGSDEQQRFLPTRFTAAGDALDARGFPCNTFACPHCHLRVPRAMFEMEPFFLSILGAPASGKSYFLTAMTWELRKVLPSAFNYAFADADPVSNRSLNEYEEMLFLNAEEENLVAIRKTELQGELYNAVNYGDQTVSYPRPFVFSLQPTERHPNHEFARSLSRALVVYDNAGEHFLPGQDTVGTQATRHLAQSSVLLFLFDPSQDPRFRRACEGRTSDAQMTGAGRTNRQESVLHEIADRIRRYTGLSSSQKFSRPLLLVVSKYDAWSSLLDVERLPTPWTKGRDDWTLMRTDYVESVSDAVRDMLWEHTPEIVSTAENFAEEVRYLPVSAMGRPPEVDRQTRMLGIRPRDIQPMWAETPMLYSLCRWERGIIPAARRQGSSHPFRNS